MQHENGGVDIGIEGGAIEIGSIGCLLVPLVISADIQYATVFGVGGGDVDDQRV